MSRIDDLIRQHAPDGVRYSQLGAIARTVSGLSGKTKADFNDGNARYVSYKNAFTNLVVNQQAPDYVTIRPSERQNRLKMGDVVITGSSESLDEVGMSSVVATEPSESLFLNSFCFGVRFDNPSLLLPDFSKYLFRAESIRSLIRSSASGVTRINISKERFMKIRIPVPPLEVQREIVRILDTFTGLEAELAAELEARLLQYDTLRAALLPRDAEDVTATTIGAVCRKVSAGATPLVTRPEYYEDGTIPWLRTQEVKYRDVTETEVKITHRAVEETSAKWIPANCVIVALSGAGVTRGRVAVNRIPLTTNQHCCSLEVDESRAHYRFVYYWLVHHYGTLRARGQGNRSDLNMGIMKSFPILLPPIDEQTRVAALLDHIDALVNDMEVGLPAELAARRLQYEHYRDRLLSFEEVVS